MKRIKVFAFWVGVVVLSACAVVAASGASVPSESLKGRSQAARGREVYLSNCARCHGADGTSHTSLGQMTEAPDLTDAAWQSRRSATRMIASVTNGRGEMPSFKRKLTRPEIAAAVAYVRTLKR